jgi:hypothetical protein
MFAEQLQEFTERVEQSISKNVAEKGTTSEFMSKMAIKVDGEYCYNLDGNRWLVEVTQNELIDNQGYQYQFNVLDLDDLCSIADHLETI